MNARNAYVFQSQIPQMMSARSNLGEISQQSADKLPKFQANPIEFDGIRMQINREENS